MEETDLFLLVCNLEGRLGISSWLMNEEFLTTSQNDGREKREPEALTRALIPSIGASPSGFNQLLSSSTFNTTTPDAEI